MPALAIAAIAVALAAVAAGAIVVWLRRQRRTPAARLRAAARDMLRDILLPDGDGGQIQFEFVLLGNDGIVIVDTKTAKGNVFAADSMHEWTVMTGRDRYTFRNPQPALYDRVAAVRALLPEAPVSGWIAFLPGAQFAKGVPGCTLQLDDLLTALTRAAQGETAPQLAAAWQTLQQVAVPAPR